MFDNEPGYRIMRRDYALPDILLKPDEAAAVGIAARLWQHAGLAEAASSGLAKLRAAGVEVDPNATLGVEPVVTVDPAFGPLTSASRVRQAVTFEYRVPEDDRSTTRRLQPWGVVCWRGRWYVVGFDLDRAAERCFRLSRIVSTVKTVGQPGAYDPPEESGPDQLRRALVRVRTEHRFATTLLIKKGRQPAYAAGRSRSCPTPDGDHVTLNYSDARGFAGWLVGYGVGRGGAGARRSARRGHRPAARDRRRLPGRVDQPHREHSRRGWPDVDRRPRPVRVAPPSGWPGC